MTAVQLIARLRAIFAADPWLIPAVRWQRDALLAKHRRFKAAGITPRVWEPDSGRVPWCCAAINPR